MIRVVVLSLDSSSEGFWVLMQSLMTKGWCSDVLQGPELSLSLTVVFTGITRSIDPRDTLSLLHSAEDQDCLRGPHQRSPVLFGVDSVSGCSLRQDTLTLNNTDHSVQVRCFLMSSYMWCWLVLSLQTGGCCQLLSGLSNSPGCSERCKLSPVCGFLWKLPVRLSTGLGPSQEQLQSRGEHSWKTVSGLEKTLVKSWIWPVPLSCPQ